MGIYKQYKKVYNIPRYKKMINLKYIKKEDQRRVISLLKKLKHHSPETYLHSLDVAETCVTIGKACGLNNKQLQVLYTSGCLHDIGKIAVSTRLLHKKGCTEAEINYIKLTHVNWTYMILKNHFDSEIVNTCYHHHERLNGKGYPQGLTAEQLSEYDKIIAVSDVISALILDRSYREHSFSDDQAIKIINMMAKNNELDSRYVKIAEKEILNHNSDLYTYKLN